MEYGNDSPFQILVIGQPKIGKSAISKELAIMLDIEYIELEELLQDVYKKVLDYEQKEEVEGDNENEN